MGYFYSLTLMIPKHQRVWSRDICEMVSNGFLRIGLIRVPHQNNTDAYLKPTPPIYTSYRNSLGNYNKILENWLH